MALTAAERKRRQRAIEKQLKTNDPYNVRAALLGLKQQQPGKTGRPRIYSSNADRQRA